MPSAVTLSLKPTLAAAAGDLAQVVGIQHIRVGDWVVTALLDGSFQFSAEQFTNVTAAEAETLLAAAFQDPAAIPIGMNAYILRNGERTVLVDTGGAGAFPGLGGVAGALAATDVAPEDVTDILLTHMHPDHIGGMLSANGAAFPNATVHVHDADVGFWSDPAMKAGAPEAAQPFFDLAVAVLDIYKSSIEPFGEDGTILEGVTSRFLPGHTPGHSGFVVGSGAGPDSLLLWGDIIVASALQFSKPDVNVVFDVLPDVAIETRQAILAETAAARMQIAGSHVAFPGIGYVAQDGDGYRFDPTPWQFSL